MTSSPPSYFGPLLDHLAQTIRLHRAGGLVRPVAEELETALHRYVREEWQELPFSRTMALDGIGPRPRKLAETLADRARTSLGAVLSAAAIPPDRVSRRPSAVARLAHAADVIAEQVVALHIAQEAESSVAMCVGVLQELSHNALIAAVLTDWSHRTGHPAPRAAPALFAAVLAATSHDPPITPRDALTMHKLGEGSPLRSGELAALADVFAAELARGQERVVGPVQYADAIGRDAFRAPEPAGAQDRADWDALPAVYRSILRELEPKHPEPKVRLGTVVKFAAAGKGQDEMAWIDGALETLQTVIAGEKRRHLGSGSPLRRGDLLHRAVADLKALAEIGSAERHFFFETEKRWSDIDQELLRLRQRDPEAPQIYPLPDTLSAIEARALYYHDAALKGVPLGILLHELASDTQATFGPTEREVFERIAFHAARTYAAGFAVERDPRVSQVSEHAVRVEEVRATLTEVERELRRFASESTDELLARGESLVMDAVDRGELRRDEVEVLLDGFGDPVRDVGAVSGTIVHAMVARLRASQEVRFLTGTLAAEGRIPNDVIGDYRHLPYVEHIALHGGPEATPRLIRARNGQTLAHLEQATRARWLHYRQDAPPGHDVRPIITAPGVDPTAIDNPLGLRGKRPFQGSSLRERLNLRRDLGRDNSAPGMHRPSEHASDGMARKGSRPR